MATLEELLRRSEEGDAFDAGMLHMAMRLANAEVATICGRRVQLVWPDGPPDQRLLAGITRSAASDAAKYGR